MPNGPMAKATAVNITSMVFEGIDKPFDPEGLRGEDTTFQMKALEKGFKSYIDTSLVVGHEKSFILM